jgi:hypothetical protein
MKNLLTYGFTLLAINILLCACPKKPSGITTTGANLSGHKNISGYNTITPELNQNLEVYFEDSSNSYHVVILPGLGNTPSWQDWDITAGKQGYRISPTEFPTQALDIAKLSVSNFITPTLSTYNSNNSTNYEFIFEESGIADVYYIKTTDGRYFTMNFTSQKMYFTNAKPAEKFDEVSRFNIK